MTRTRQIAQLAMAMLCAFAVKWFYSTASVDQLRWILWPTTKLVEFVTGARFEFESHAGYMNSEHTFLIAASCAGVNFLITAFVMLSLRKLWRRRNCSSGFWFIPIAAAVAYATTIVTNAVRISLALQSLHAPSSRGWLSANELHRFEGVLVYFGCLLLLFVLTEEIDQRSRRDGRPPARTVGLSRLLFPIGIYYAMTLGIPLLNGGYRQGNDFWAHCAFVLLIPLALVTPVILLRLLRYARLWRAGTRDPCVPGLLRPRRRLSHPAMLSQNLD